ncbi:MAG: MFS transporter [Anaerolineae bacterium]|nr:MFS transporter [Anaerolineae bacterium]
MEHTRERRSKWQIPFFTVWTGQQFSLIGSHVLQFALVWWLTQLTGSATVLAMATMMWVIPQVFLGPIVGAYVDRLNRRVVMIVADSLIALVALWLAYLFWADTMQVWHVYAALLVRAIGGLFHWSTMQASTSLMVPDEHLTRVAGLNQTMQGALNVIGPPLGALLLAVLPFEGIMLMDVGTAAFAILPLFFVAIPQPERTLTKSEKPSVWSDVREGLRYVRGWPGLLAVLIMATVINFVVNPAFSLMPLLVTEHFNGDAPQLAWLESSWGVGLVLGGLLLSAWGGFRRRVYTSLMGLMIEGLGITLVGLAPANVFWLAVAGMFVAGSMNALVNGPLFAVLQAIVAPKMQGRVFAVVASMSSAAFPLSLAVAGPVADAIGLRPWYVVGGIVCTLMGLGACFVPVIVNIEQNHNGHNVVGSKTLPAAAVPANIEAE